MPSPTERQALARNLVVSYQNFLQLRERLRMQRKRRELRLFRKHGIWLWPFADEDVNDGSSQLSDVHMSSLSSLSLSSPPSSSTTSTSSNPSFHSFFSSSSSSAGWSSDDEESDSSTGSSWTTTTSSDDDPPVPDLLPLDDSDSDSEDDDSGWSSTSGRSSDDEWEDMGGVEEHQRPPTLLSRVRRALSILYSKRYLRSRRNRLPQIPPQMPFILAHANTHRTVFRQDLRINPETFDELVEAIQDDPVFSNNSRYHQMDVSHQLAIALYRFGHFGNAASLTKVSRWAGCAKGTVSLVTRRVMTAVLRESFLKHSVRLPNSEEKEKAKEWVERHSCEAWRDGWCFVDGTLIPLYVRPHWYGESYFDRKSNYSLNFQVINLPSLEIIDYGYGFTGSTHDATAWEQTLMYQNCEQIFQDDEFVWADSAYPIQTWVVCPFRRPDSDIPDNTTFNKRVSHLRIRSEHAIGFLKGRFQSLKGLRVLIFNRKSHCYATYWAVSCIRIHAFATRSELKHHARVAKDPFIRAGLGKDAELDSLDGGRATVIPERPLLQTSQPQPRQTTLAAARRKREDLKQQLLSAQHAPMTSSDDSSSQSSHSM